VGINTAGAIAAPLTVWGSWVSEVSPDALPENVSADNQDVVYGPGFVASRPALDTIAGITFPAVGGIVPTAVYGKSFLLPTLAIRNLYLDSAGRMWVEDFTNAPGVITLLFQSTPGSLCRSSTFQGREYIAISDGLHGTEAPLVWDGTNMDRVTITGPGAPPAISNLQLPAVPMAASGNTLTRLNNVVSCVTADPHNLKVGYQALIANVPDSNATTVNQTKQSFAQNVNGSYWDFNSGQWRSLFNPGTSPLSAFVAEDFVFNIPAGATILGIVINFGVLSQSATAGTVAEVALWNSSGQVGTAKTPGTAIITTPVYTPYGSASDTWGASLTPSVVNDPTFGFAISIDADGVRDFLQAPLSMTIYYTLSGSGTVATVSSIVIANEVNPGLALVTTTQPHGLIPGISISLVGVEPYAVGGGLAAAEWSSGKTTLTTVSDHGLLPGAVIQVAGATTSTATTAFSFNGNFTVLEVPSPNQLTYYQSPITAADPDVIDATASTGTVSIAWPIPSDTPTPTYFEVDSCPTPTTFYIPVDYADGTWNTGSVGFIWEGTFYVIQVQSATEFSYYQPGPNGATTAVGTVTPFGQAAPGLHLVQVLWLTRQGIIPAPSPFLQAILNGGQYVQVANIPIGPPGTIARILAFTGAQPDIPGILPPFYYIPVPAFLEGQVVSTATVINDNTTTGAVLDFSDNTLYAATGISIPGNNLANQVVLDGALGFSSYLSRLGSWGQRNVIQNLLNLGFEGGYTGGGAPGTGLAYPLGWTAGTGTLVNALFGMAWQVLIGVTPAENGMISQPAATDASGDPIFIGNQSYSIRFRAFTNGGDGVGLTVWASLTSAATGFSSTAEVPVGNSTLPQWFEGDFSLSLPTEIPPDLVFSVWVQGTSGSASATVTIDDLQPIFAEAPYLDTTGFFSYVGNPSGIDGDTGKWGPQDTAKLMNMGIVRGTLAILTQAPSGKLHETTGSTVTEPSGWAINPVQSECGILSAFALTLSQADDASEADGGDWMAWASDVGAMIYGGGTASKISQEIQPNWNPGDQSYPWIPANSSINFAAAIGAWVLNDPASRLIYFGLPIGTATAPNKIYALNYQHLGSAQAIADSPPFHPSFAGKLIATDNSRKWTRWNMSMNGAARMYRSGGELTTVLMGGNGLLPNSGASAYGHIYKLNANQWTDSDYGQIAPYYCTYFFLDPERAQQMQLKNGRLLMAYIMAQIQPPAGMASGQSQVTLQYLCDSLSNIWPLSTTRSLTVPFPKDRNFGGGMAQGERIAVKISSWPVSGTDNGFILTRFTAWLKNARILTSGVNQ
jgi:hypothetical protein